MRNLVLVFLFTLTSIAQAQRFAFVDTEKIMEQIPAYKAAQEQLDKLAEEYLKEIERQKTLENIQENYSKTENFLEQKNYLLQRKSLIEKMEEDFFSKNRKIIINNY